jgi:lipopolysaccharide transport protein LptA
MARRFFELGVALGLAVVIVAGMAAGVRQTDQAGPNEGRVGEISVKKERAPDAKTAGAEGEDEEVHIKGDHWRYDGKTKVSEFWGNVEATQGDTKFTCEKITYSEETEKGICSGDEIRVTDPEGWATATAVEFDTKEKVAALVGNVVIVYTPKDKQAEAKGDGDGRTQEGEKTGLRGRIEGKVTMTCDRADYNYKKKIAQSGGPVTMRDEKRTLSAASATFDRNTEIAVLVGNVRVVDDKDRVMTATKVEASFKDGDEWIVGENVTWKGKIEEEEEGQPGGEQEAQPPQS